ncbi:unnamed protein product [Lactuca saligna]|uniref:Ubiquitin-like protease family profile domain-containing protein n=1 Tax=Lactuca saligna TaxID=75948 RepID=A0AA36E740_LACSI|nr:unnamed protein product [Lactuca saligna]CAI9284669.1 unnamed protein product [Lactuca saligna]
MFDERVNEDVRYKEFEVMVSSAIEDLTTDSELKNVDLVFFPIVDGNYYLICFNLKSFSILIIDQRRLVGTVESVYGNIPHVLQKNSCRFLNDVYKKRVKTLMTRNVVMLKMKCQAYNHSDDGGIYLMRHMERFMGDQTSKWDCGLAVDFIHQDLGNDWI